MGHELVSRPSRLLIAGAVAALAAGTMPAANAAIELGDGLSATGFLDMSYWSNNKDGDPGSFGIDQFETDFLFKGTNGVSAEVDIEYGDSNAPGGPAGGDQTFVEQAFVTKAFTDKFSVKLGRFLSYTGWETEEPTGLFQYSGAGYAQYFYGYYQQGISAYYKGGMFDLMGSVITHPFDGWTYETDQVGYEVGAAVMPVEGLTAKLFYIVDTVDGADDTKILNFWTSYAWNGFTFAGEYNNAKYSGPSKGDGYLLMANYAKGPYGVTVRYTDYDIKTGFGGSYDKDKSITLSPSYKVGDNLLLVSEVRRDNSFGFKSTSFALEALFTF